VFLTFGEKKITPEKGEIKSFSVLLEPFGVFDVQLFHYPNRNLTCKRRFEKPIFYRQALREGLIDDFRAAEYIVRLPKMKMTFAVPKKPGEDEIEHILRVSLASKGRTGNKRWTMMTGEKGGRDNFRAGAFYLNRYYVYNFKRVLMEATRQERWLYMVNFSVAGAAPSYLDLGDEIGVIRFVDLSIPVSEEAQLTMDLFMKERKAGEKRIKACVIVANGRFLLLRFRNWINPVTPSIIESEIEALKWMKRFLERKIHLSGIIVYVLPSIDGGEKVVKKLVEHGIYVLRVPHIQPEELLRYVREWYDIDLGKIYPSSSGWPLRVRDMILAFVAKYLKIQLLKKKNESIKIVNGSLLFENYRFVEKIKCEGLSQCRNDYSERNEKIAFLFETKSKREEAGGSEEKISFPHFSRDEVDVFHPIFSFYDDSEIYELGGYGPPRNVDPRLLLFLSLLLGDDIYTILCFFDITEFVDVVAIRPRRFDGASLIIKRFHRILNSIISPYDDPSLPFQGIRIGDDPWTLIIPRHLYIPPEELEREIAYLGLREMESKREERMEGDHRDARLLNALRERYIILEDFEWDNRILAVGINPSIFRKLDPCRLTVSGILAERDRNIVYSAKCRIYAKKDRRRFRWKRKTGRFDAGKYRYVNFYRNGHSVGSSRNLEAAVRNVSREIFGTEKPRPWGALLIIDQMLRTVAIQIIKLDGKQGGGVEVKKAGLIETFNNLLRARRSVVQSVFPIKEGAEYVPYKLFYVACMFKRGIGGEREVKATLRKILDDKRISKGFVIRFIDLTKGV